jgi:hypothetical protein
MRYLTITYYRKASGQIDEATAVTKNLKTRDYQCANVILDFKELKVIKASMGGDQVPKDWDRIVSYFYQHYTNIIERLFQENGHELPKPDAVELATTEETQPVDQ